jgi:hypothetical protein
MPESSVTNAVSYTTPRDMIPLPFLLRAGIIPPGAPTLKGCSPPYLVQELAEKAFWRSVN